MSGYQNVFKIPVCSIQWHLAVELLVATSPHALLPSTKEKCPIVIFRALPWQHANICYVMQSFFVFRTNATIQHVIALALHLDSQYNNLLCAACWHVFAHGLRLKSQTRRHFFPMALSGIIKFFRPYPLGSLNENAMTRHP